MKKTNNKGFSLVELIIVIAIMAILIGVLAPQYIKYVEKSRASADKDLLDSVYKACATAASDPEVDSSTVPGTQFDFDGSITPGAADAFNTAVLATLGADDGAKVAAKLKSKSCNSKAITVSVDGNGNFYVWAKNSAGTTSIRVPEQ